MFTKLNEKYWAEESATNIIGNNPNPSEELFSKVKNGSKVLDVGFGSGVMTNYLAKQGYQVTGVDLNRDTISKNTLKKSPVDYVLGDVTERLPFNNNSFDAVIAAFIFASLIEKSELKRAVEEITRVLEPGGIVWLNDGLASPD